MLKKLIEQVDRLNQAREARAKRKELLTDSFLRFNNLIKDVWTEHMLPETKITIDGCTFVLSKNGCGYSGDIMTQGVLNKLMQSTFEILVEQEKQYNCDFVE